jgi:hypothetical protein
MRVPLGTSDFLDRAAAIDETDDPQDGSLA